MSLHLAAKHLASKGRDEDTELVHMTKGEVKGLQALAMAGGGSLSINPDTGLVEAGFLKNMLPTLVGAGLMMVPGMQGVGAGMIGGGLGLLEYARTGDLGKGLMAGLGAYGGAGLTSGLMSAGATNAAAGAINTAAGSATGAASGLSSLPQGVSPTVGQIASGAGSAAVPPSTFMGNLSQAGQGLSNVAGSGDAAMKFAGENMRPLMAAATPMVAGSMEQPAPPGEEEYVHPYGIKRLSSNFTGYVPQRPSPYYSPTGLGYAAGGVAELAQGGSFDDQPGEVAFMASGGMTLGQGIYRDSDEDTASLGAYDAARKRVEKQFGAANLKAKPMPKTGIARLGEIKTMASGGLGGYSDGGRMLKGPGDGMSDSIPAVIGKKQPARLADGEFVVPADVVSHLGNGSTDAGAKRLYSMMDKVRQARTGKKKQAPAVKADKYMPA